MYRSPNGGELPAGVGIPHQGPAGSQARRTHQANQERAKNLDRGGSAAFETPPTRIEAFVLSDGMYATALSRHRRLFREQGSEPDRKKREAILT